MKKIIETTAAPAPIGPYNQAVLAGQTLYCSGQIAINPKTGELLTQDLIIETTQVLENLKAVIEKAGFQLRDVVKCSIFLSNMEYFAKVNKVYGQYFTEMEPARETVAVQTLPKNVNVEISAIAVRS